MLFCETSAAGFVGENASGRAGVQWRQWGCMQAKVAHSQGSCNPVKDPAVSDVKLIYPLTRGEALSLRGEKRSK